MTLSFQTLPAISRHTRKENEAAKKYVGRMMSLLGKEKEPLSKKISSPTNEFLKVERK
jgi:hypothetical protein